MVSVMAGLGTKRLREINYVHLTGITYITTLILYGPSVLWVTTMILPDETVIDGNALR